MSAAVRQQSFQRSSVGSGSFGKALSEDKLLKKVTEWPLACLMLIGGILIGQFSFWNYGLVGGFGNYLLAMLVSGAMYFCLANSLSELSSVLPFAGGTYGYVRVTLGIYFGYIIGCCELVSYLVLSSITYLYFGATMTILLKTTPLLEPLWWFVLAVLLVGPMVRNKYYWHLNAVLGIITIAWVLLFFFTPCVKAPSFSKYAHSEDIAYFEGSASGFMAALGPASLLYLGIEIFPLMSEDIKNPKEAIPKATMCCTYVVLAISIVVVLITCSTTSIDVLVEQDFPLILGYHAIFGTDDNKNFRIVLIPPMYLMSSSFQLAYSRLIFAMARSGLFPPVLGNLCYGHSAPRNAIYAGTAVLFPLIAFAWTLNTAYESVLSGGILAAVCAYFAMFISFIIFRLHFEGLQREYNSPVGIPGAVLGMGVSVLIIVSIIVTNVISAVFLAAIVFFFSVYYYFAATTRQKLSAEEKEVMLVAHVIKANRIAAARRHKRRENQRTRRASHPGGVPVPAVLPLRHRDNTGATKTNTAARVFAVLPEITLQPIKKPGECDPRYTPVPASIAGNDSTAQSSVVGP